MNLTDILSGYEPYEELRQSVEAHNTPISLAGITLACIPHLAFQLFANTGRRMLVLTYSDSEAAAIASELRQYHAKAYNFPSRDYIYYNIEDVSRKNEYDRLTALDALINSGESVIVTASLDALTGATAARRAFDEYTVTLKLGGIFEPSDLVKRLVLMGYERESIAETRGQFSARGGIVDVFPVNSRVPVRIEFFDNEIDSIREFDPYSQRSEQNINAVRIAPAAELLYTYEKRDEIVASIECQLRPLVNAEGEDNEAVVTALMADIDNFKERFHFPAADKYLPQIYDKFPSILDYLDRDDIVMVVDSKRIKERGEFIDREKTDVISGLIKKKLITGNVKSFWMQYRDAVRRISAKNAVIAEPFSFIRGDFVYKAKTEFNTKETPSFHGKIEYMYDDVSSYVKNGMRVAIFASNRGRGENIAGVLAERGIESVYVHDSRDIIDGKVTVMRGSLAHGFVYPDVKAVIISDKEIFTSEKRERVVRKSKNAERIKSFNDINEGDYVVHQAHGIGVYAGTKKITVQGVTKDYLQINYAGTDMLYVPADQLDILYKYTKTSDRPVKVNSLNSSEWSKAKQRVRKSTGKMAKELVALYSEREKAKGFQFSTDGALQREFEDTFPYQETQDQLRSIEEVKHDMESPRPMDRLLCGDVGFGKTEVAIRAAFKAVTDSKQVAYLCPTTVLAMQHYETFVKRMEKFPVKVEMLSRFRTPSEQERIVKRLRSGEIDIIIGTHKLLNKDVIFKDLGLLIIDEEQRFGVTHKERMKELKKNIDVLTMTATPIPRTLHMSMINIRDMSVLAEPPENRYPVQTFVLEDNSEVILEAIRNELSRGGQVYYLHNRVQGIYSVANQIKAAIPEARVAVGHGQMKERELEDIMYDMVSGETDVLVCTTIIETGLDIPNANTIIIENADRMGLAQLYQLRGRVGRSNKIAYAYMTYNKNTVLPEAAEKRLRAVKEFTEFGSGFKIAMRDLEIRGAGNVLGSEQHGHMDTVGYDMYCKILRESINEAEGKTAQEEISTTVDIDVNAFISDAYIPSGEQRINMYKRISAIENEDDCMEIRDELIDRYGDIPKACDNIIRTAYMKAIAKSAFITSVYCHGGNLRLTFAHGKLDAQTVMALNRKIPAGIRLASQDEPTITVKLRQTKDPITRIIEILNIILEVTKKKSEVA